MRHHLSYFFIFAAALNEGSSRFSWTHRAPKTHLCVKFTEVKVFFWAEIFKTEVWERSDSRLNRLWQRDEKMHQFYSSFGWCGMNVKMFTHSHHHHQHKRGIQSAYFSAHENILFMSRLLPKRCPWCFVPFHYLFLILFIFICRCGQSKFVWCLSTSIRLGWCKSPFHSDVWMFSVWMLLKDKTLMTVWKAEKHNYWWNHLSDNYWNGNKSATDLVIHRASKWFMMSASALQTRKDVFFFSLCHS